MEAMDICIATTKEISYLIVNHPLYSAVGSCVLFILLLRFYCRLTLGMCDCDEDLTGKTVLVTGASAGVGKGTALDMARRNARVLLACRNVGKASKVAQEIVSSTGNDKVVVVQLDLCSFESVRKCAKKVIATEDKLHILINNAGAIENKRELTEDGCEKTMQANHLGHFLLTLLLLDLLKRSAPSRIINVSSGAYPYGKLDLDDLTNEKLSPSFNVYANTKMANVLFTKELARRLAGTSVTVNTLNPGFVKTDIVKNTEGWFVTGMNIMYLPIGKSIEEGAQTTIYLAVHPEVEKTTGKYFSDCKEEKIKGKANDKALAKRLFELSEEIVGHSFT